MKLNHRTNVRASYLPRPALGRRPWFAFLRRARRRRRFAFAMGGERTRAPERRHSAMVRLVAGGWQSPPLRLARSRLERSRGLAPCPGPLGLLMRSRCIHGFGLRSQVEFVAFDAAGVVTRTGTLHPRRIAFCRGTTWIAELPSGSALPGREDAVLVDRLTQCPAR